MPTPQSKVWPLGYKTAASTYERLRCGVTKPLTDRRIAHYARLGLYGDNAKICQEEIDGNKKRKTKAERVSIEIDDLAG